MLSLHQQVDVNTIYKMPAVEDLSSERNFLAHCMFDSSRAGVFLDPTFAGLKINTDNLLSGHENIPAFPAEGLHLSESRSVSDDSLCEEQMLEPGSSCTLQQDTAETSLPAAAYNVESSKADFVRGGVDGRNKSDCCDPLLQKLEQLKELQQQKQEQLKKQQMEQLQRLMEEQQKLLSMVSDQTAILGKNMWCPEQKMEKITEAEDPHDDPLCVEGTDLSEKSSRGKQLWVTNTEERPIKAAIQEKKQTFEEFLEEQIQIEEQRLKQSQKLQETNGSAIQKPVIKRPFLKRGEGLTRFTNAKSKITMLGESMLKPPQRVSDDRNIRVDRSQIQKKSLPPSKELVSGSPLMPRKKNNQPDKVKYCPIQKTLVLRNHNGKNTAPLETRMQPGKNLDGQMRDSFPSEINHKIENKENVVEFAKSNAGKIRNKLPGMEKPQLSCELASAFSNVKCPAGHPVKDSELSFEVSFQNKLENWEKEKEKENLELDEFLFLEQAADEISFSSNSSFVQRILDQDQQASEGRRMSSTPIKAKQQQVKELAVKLINAKNKKAECITQGNNKAVTHAVSNSGIASRLKDPVNKTDSVMFSGSSLTAVPALKSTQWTLNEDKDEENGDTTTDSEQEFETTLKNENEDVKESFQSNRESDPGFFEYGSSTDISKESKCGGDLSDEDCSTLSKQKIRQTSDHQRSVSCINRNKIEFDDERTWSDLDEYYFHNDLPEKYTKTSLQTSFFSKNDTAVPDKAIKRKVASKKGDELSKQPAVDSDANGPPASNLMMKLFPSLKPKQKAGCHSEHEIKSNVEQESGAERTATGNTVPSQILREKLIELEMEIERFRAENTTLTKLREEREHALASIRKEIADFQQQKAQELAEIEDYRKKEMKKLQKERKVFEKYTTEARAIPDKKERDEIQALKQQIAELQEDLKRKEAKWSTTHRRLKDQIEALVNENMELKEEVKIMERFRLEAWKKVEAAGSKKKIENSGVTLKRAESVSLPNRGLKSQTGSPLLPAQKGGKISGKNYSQAKGKLSRTPASAPANDRSNSETAALEDSSRTFMVDSSPHEALVPAPSGPEHTDGEEIQREIAYPDGKVEKVLKNGCHLIFFPNGTWKKVGSDGKTVTITFFNGDVKQIMPDQTVIYYYADAKTTHTTYCDGLEVLQFSNGQIEKHYPDGKKEITFPDQTIKNLFTDGQEESIFPDGTIVRVQRDGSKTIEFNNGQRELHTSQFKRREYPDGTVKTVYTNGHQETKYVSGRVRVKDKDGNILMDTKV